VTTSTGAADCVVALAYESVDARAVPALRTFAAPSFLEAVYPPLPVCGDGVVNQTSSAVLPVGEECDGQDDSACPGACIVPGDVFECTCGTIPRMRLFTDGALSENDSGWTGLAHDQRLGPLSGFVSSLSDCDCSEMQNGECVGTSLDPVCSVSGRLEPRCSWANAGPESCDDVGDTDGSDEDSDCFICDAPSGNSGAPCVNDAGCDSLCYDADLMPGAACDRQTDCPAQQTCRGRCDTTPTCIHIPNGAPHPVSAGGVAVCAVQHFAGNVTGTRNLLDGSHSLSYGQYSKIHFPESQERPCPVCGGFCEGGSKNLSVCQGRCKQSGAACRFDSDCPGTQTCVEESPDCSGGKCRLALVCGADPAINAEVVGRPCRISFEDPVFGTPSSDCPPAESLNISGQGLAIDYLPATSGTSMLPSTVPCTASGLELYDCPCPDDGGQPTAPNSCSPACNAGSSVGLGCADGTGSGAGTVCAGGDNDGRLCDEDADCPDGACSLNPTHCVGDPSFEHIPCTTPADCGSGSCVDACPGGRCVPLCVPVGGEPGEGQCAAGPLDHNCSGEAWSFRTCLQASAGAGCAATCAETSAPCAADADCATGDRCEGACEQARDCEAGVDGVLGTNDDIKGAGLCVGRVRECFLDPIVASGAAASLSQHDSVALWCLGATHNVTFDAPSGFGGPARVHIRGSNVVNFSAVPP
jgi:hypothetical protein